MPQVINAATSPLSEKGIFDRVIFLYIIDKKSIHLICNEKYLSLCHSKAADYAIKYSRFYQRLPISLADESYNPLTLSFRGLIPCVILYMLQPLLLPFL